MIKDILAPVLRDALQAARAAGDLSADLSAEEMPPVILDTPPREDFGDYSCNMAMLLARAERKSPLAIAGAIRDHLRAPEGLLREVRVEKPGFLNFYLQTDYLSGLLGGVLKNPAGFGRSEAGAGRSVHLEFVSANPTGPLHVGHGRGAAVGDALGRVLEACGHRVHREYYVNDAGNQMEMLGDSAVRKHFQMRGENIDFPEEGYKGKYIEEIAASSTYAESVLQGDNRTFEEIVLAGDEDRYITASATFTSQTILEKIKEDLAAFRVAFDEWFSERSLFEGEVGGRVGEMIRRLEAEGKIYERGGALWLRSTELGDEKDRVVVREDGRPTYLASDIAYHDLKFRRGFDRCVNIWGADHHGYLPRVRAAVAMLGHDPEKLKVLFVQFVSLRRGGQPVQMSTRSGQFEELSAVVDEVGVDAARFFFLMRSADTTLEFDLDLAKEQSSENPVYYVQYAHARTCSLFRQAAAEGVDAGAAAGIPAGGLTLPEEHRLALAVLEWPEVVRTAAERLEPHHVTFALMALAKQFHAYYNRHRFLGQAPGVTRARLGLARCVQAVVANGLGLLGVSAPEQM